MGKVGENMVNLYVAEGALFHRGHNVQIEPFTSIICKYKMYIGNDVVIAPGVVIVDFDHNLADPRKIQEDGEVAEVTIGDNVWIGANATILKGVHIGNDAVVGAGSVVAKDIPEGEIWVGNPAHFLKKR